MHLCICLLYSTAIQSLSDSLYTSARCEHQESKTENKKVIYEAPHPLHKTCPHNKIQ